MLAFHRNETSRQDATFEEADKRHAWQARTLVRKIAEVLPLGGRQSAERQNLLLRVFREHERDLRRFLHARGASGPDCDDLAQEAFLRLARQDGLELRLASSPGKIRAYLIVIASNLIYDMRRRNLTRHLGRHDSAENVTLVDRRPTPEQAIAIEQTLSAVQAVLAGLDPKSAEAFRMSRFHDMSYEEIGRRLNVSASMIEKYVARALVAIRAQVDFKAVER